MRSRASKSHTSPTPSPGTDVAYDEAIAQQIRELLAGDATVEEKKMFGGLGFLVNGNMAVAASGQGGLLVRVDPAEGEKLVASTKAEPMEMRGRQMAGWLRVEAGDDLPEWVERGRSYASSLPPK
jgi:TfoX N-terminal domain